MAATIKSLHIRNFTVFTDVHVDFSPQINVIVGENGVGKSHLLKLPYSILSASAEDRKKPDASGPTKAGLQQKLAEKLIGVLRPESLGRLARRQTGRAQCQIECRFSLADYQIDFQFSTRSESNLSISKLPSKWITPPPVFLPTRELLSIFPNFVSVYDNSYLDYEETWRDTCVLLGAPAVRGAREAGVRELLTPLEDALGGKIELDKSGRFYLNIPTQGRFEIPLVAEGLRKLAMLARLIATGSLLDKGYLFWDEPEANLNPKLIRQVARVILQLCKHGIQVFIASHSLFLLRELDILLRSPEFESMKPQFIGLHPGDDGVTVEQGSTLDDIGDITSLHEELLQSDRYLDDEGSA